MQSQFLNPDLAEEQLKKSKEQFKKYSAQLKYNKKPTGRTCSDCHHIIALIICLLLLSAFVGVGAFLISQAQQKQKQKTNALLRCFGVSMGFTFLIIFIFMVGSCCCNSCIRGFVILAAMITNAILLGLAYVLYSDSDKNLSMKSSISFFILAVFYSVIICFNYKDLSRSVTMLEGFEEFFNKGKTVNKSAIFMFLFSFILTFLWVNGFIGILNKEGSSYYLLSILWAIFYIFIFLLTHYMSTFLSTYSFGTWFYHEPEDPELKSKFVQEVQQQQNNLNNSGNEQMIGSRSQLYEPNEEEQTSSPLKLCIKYFFIGFGVISYATLIFPFVTIVNIMYQLAKYSEVKCCFGCLLCFLKWLDIEMKAKTYNDYTVIVSALTGVSYGQSSSMLVHCSNRTYEEDENNDKQKIKDPKEYLSQSLNGFNIVSQASLLFRFVLVFFTSSIITLGYTIYIKNISQSDSKQKIQFDFKEKNFLVTGNLAVFFGFAIIINSFFQIYSNSTTVFYLIYRLDAKLATLSKDKKKKICWYKEETKICKYRFDEAFSGINPGVIPQIPLIKFKNFKKEEKDESSSEQMQNSSTMAEKSKSGDDKKEEKMQEKKEEQQENKSKMLKDENNEEMMEKTETKNEKMLKEEELV